MSSERKDPLPPEKKLDRIIELLAIALARRMTKISSALEASKSQLKAG